MSPGLAIGLFVLLGLTAVLAWRYFRLRHALRQYAEAVRLHPQSAPANTDQLEDLGGAFRNLAEEFEGELASLRADRNRLAAVLDQMTDGVLIADAQGRVQFSNPAARRMFESPDPLGRSVTEVLRQHQLVAVWQRASETGELSSDSVELPTRRQVLHLIAMPDKHAAGSLLLIQDLTRLRRLETVRQDFVSNISHELRTPLASLKALAETLQAGALSDPQAAPHFLESIVTEVDALTQMSQELLDLARIESGQVDLDLQRTLPRDLLQAAADRMQIQTERAGLRILVDAPEGLAAARADQIRLEQVLVNLIHNAVKFTPPGGEIILSAAEVSSVEGRPAEVWFSVKDTGVGIPADDLPRVFERFYRVDKSRAGSGTGLGLAIARHVVEAHGGRIWVESVEGQGSTFSFAVPAD